MSVTFGFDDQVVVVTGASGALGSAVAAEFSAADATVCAVDVREPDAEDALLDPELVEFYEADLTEETAVAETIGSVVDRYGRLDHLCNIAGTWRGGDSLDETDADLFDLLFDVNLRTMFLASKYAIPHVREAGGSILSVSARSSLEGGTGDGLYRASKAGVRLLTETIAEENRGELRANAVLPSVIDTPANREAMPDADASKWVQPEAIARVVAFLCSDAAGVTSGAAVPVYGEA